MGESCFLISFFLQAIVHAHEHMVLLHCSGRGVGACVGFQTFTSLDAYMRTQINIIYHLIGTFSEEKKSNIF